MSLCHNDKQKKQIHRHMFTKYEDDQIITLHKIHGEKCWEIIKNKLNLKDARSAKDRFAAYLSKNNGPFSTEEDNQIIILYKKFGPRWKLIANYMNNRSDIQVRNRYRRIIRENIAKIQGQEKNKERVAKIKLNTDRNVEDSVSYEENLNFEFWVDESEDVFANF